MGTVSSTVGNKDNNEQQQPMILKEDDDNSGKILKLNMFLRSVNILFQFHFQYSWKFTKSTFYFNLSNENFNN